MIVESLDPGNDFATSKFVDGILTHVRFRDVAAMHADVLVVEYPVYYPGGSPATSVIRLAFNAGLVAGRIVAGRIAEVPTVDLPKYVVQRRVRAALSAEELAALDRDLAVVPKGKQNNCYDSVRHGLVFLERMAR